MKHKGLWTLVGFALALCSLRASADKQNARDVATGLSLISAGAATIPTGITQAAGAGGLIGQGAGFLFMGIWDTFASAPAAPDPNHGVLPSFMPSRFTPITGTGPVFDSANDSLLSAGHVLDDSRLLNASLQRYYGAINDSNLTDAQMQQAAASGALFALQADVLAYRNALTSLSSDVQGTSFASLSTTVSDAMGLRDQIVASGFPAYETFALSEANATPQEISLAIQEVGLANGSTITDADLQGSVIFDRYATALGKVDFSELLPSTFTVVPEPSTWMFPCGAFLAISALAWRKRQNRKPGLRVREYRFGSFSGPRLQSEDIPYLTL